MGVDISVIFDLRNILSPDRVLRDVLLKDHTTFKTGGPAGAFVLVENNDELARAVAFLKNREIPFFVLGNGSNLLVSDSGFDGAVIKLSGSFNELSVSDNVITAGAGVLLSKVCLLAEESGLSGLEFAYGIPGTLGGATVMNAGAYDGEMSYVVSEVTVLDGEGIVRTLSCEDMHFGYRDSIIKHSPMIVLSAKMTLEPGDRAEIHDKMADFLQRRKSKQPLEFPSAGSTFKRPVGYFAGKLIEDAGLKGKRIGGACVSEKHAGFIVNTGGATASDINMLMETVEEEVYQRFGVKLEPEVIKLGKF
ncbi:MAG: UDP-N-acetylmuramate dehydrogenase [Lachnospiraceae bacterium]|nr:UDP-N-acetylmuramate dehydrogenase [Lachnospiraceae bacterium]